MAALAFERFGGAKEDGTNSTSESLSSGTACCFRLAPPPLQADLPASVALGTVRSTKATGATVMRWSRVDSDIPRLMVSRTLGAAGESCRS